MKLRKLIPCLFIANSLALGNASAAVLWESDFADTNTYPPGETVVGNGGWTKISFQSDNDDDAYIGTFSGQNVLTLTSTATIGNGYTTLRNSFSGAAAESIVRVQFGLAWSTTTELVSGGGVHFGAWDYSIPLSVTYSGGTSSSTTRGLRVSGAGGPHLLLAQDLIKTNYMYQFDITINYDTKTFSVNLKGEDVNGNAVDQTLSNIGFNAGSGTDFNALTRLYVSNNIGRVANMSIDRITVSQIPEGATAANLAFGGLIVAGLAYRRRLRAAKA